MTTVVAEWLEERERRSVSTARFEPTTMHQNLIFFGGKLTGYTMPASLVKALVTPAFEVSCCDMRCIVFHVLIPTLLVTVFTALLLLKLN